MSKVSSLVLFCFILCGFAFVALPKLLSPSDDYIANELDVYVTNPPVIITVTAESTTEVTTTEVTTEEITVTTTEVLEG